MDILQPVVNGLITALFVAMATYVVFRWQKNSLKKEVTDYLNSENGQQAIYSIGILLGSAIAQGSGINKFTKGQGGFKGMIMTGLGQLFQRGMERMMPQATAGDQPQT